MKTPRISTVVLPVLLSAAFFVHADGMNGMNMKVTPMQGQVTAQEEANVHHGTGVVQKVDVANGRVIIAHGPINSLHWPPMTMGFAVQDKKLLEHLIVGERIDFDLVQSAKDQYVVTRITPVK